MAGEGHFCGHSTVTNLTIKRQTVNHVILQSVNNVRGGIRRVKHFRMCRIIRH